MNTEKSVERTKAVLYASLAVGLILLVVGILLEMLDSSALPNNKAVVGLSFIPLAVAFSSYVKLLKIRRSPDAMKAIIIAENDERLKALRNEAEANAFRILQAILFLAYMGYTLMVPADVFESAGWWILTFLLLSSFVLQGVLLTRAMSGNDSGDDDTTAVRPLSQK